MVVSHRGGHVKENCSQILASTNVPGTDGALNQLVQLLGLAGTLNLADKRFGKVIG